MAPLLLAGCAACESSSTAPPPKTGAAAAPREKEASRASRHVRLEVNRAAALRFTRTLTGTRVSSALQRVEQTASACPHLRAQGALDDLPTVVAALACAEDVDGEANSPEVRLVESDSGEVLVEGDVDESGLLTLSVREAAKVPPFLLPAGEDPGPALLALDDVAFGGQLRARAISLTAAPSSSVLPDLSALLTERALDGRLAFALLAPKDGSAALPVVLAFGVKERALVERGVDVAFADMARRYGVTRAALAADPAAPHRKRACLGPLRLVEGLAPCVMVDDQRAVFSWNAEAMERALARPPPSSSEERAGLHLHRTVAARAGEAIAKARYGARAKRSAPLPATLEMLAPTTAEAARGIVLVVRVGGEP